MAYYDVDMDSRVGEIHKTANNTNIEIISTLKDIRGRTLYQIKFENGYISNAYYVNIKANKVKDIYAPSVCGKGFLGLAKYDKNSNYKEYHIWRSILKRCYDNKSKDFKNYGGKGVTVCERWLCFEHFLKDIRLVEGYNEELFYTSSIDLDKDMKQLDKPYNKRIYSKETCIFLSKKDNSKYSSRVLNKKK